MGGIRGRHRNWKSQRNERKIQKIFSKHLRYTTEKHFEIDIERSHRLRCIYAWADKSHQDGKVDSVLVSSSTTQEGEGTALGLGGGRSRYVELYPKITFHEFRQVQEEHFPHLDRMPMELCQCLKEEVWVAQGKGRQNRELKREVTGFLVLVAVLDALVIMN